MWSQQSQHPTEATHGDMTLVKAFEVGQGMEQAAKADTSVPARGHVRHHTYGGSSADVVVPANSEGHTREGKMFPLGKVYRHTPEKCRLKDVTCRSCHGEVEVYTQSNASEPPHGSTITIIGGTVDGVSLIIALVAIAITI